MAENYLMVEPGNEVLLVLGEVGKIFLDNTVEDALLVDKRGRKEIPCFAAVFYHRTCIALHFGHVLPQHMEVIDNLSKIKTKFALSGE